MYLITLLRPMVWWPPFFGQKNGPFLVSVRGNRLDLGSPELGQALVAEAVPDVVKEVAAVLSVLVRCEFEVSVDIAASETQYRMWRSAS